MSDTPSTPEVPEQPAQADEQEQAPVEEIDWKAEARKWESRAKENKTAAERLAEIEDAQKSEAQKAAERLTAAEKAADDARREALRYKVATRFGVSDEDAELFLTGPDEDTLARQAERLATRNAEANGPRTPRPDPTQGRQGAGTATTADQFAAAVGGLLKS